MTHKTLLLCILAAGFAPAQPPLRVVDLDAGASEEIELAQGTAKVTLLSTSETRDKIRNAIRSAGVEVEINGVRATIACGNYRLPVAAGGVQADCAVTKAYYGNSNADHWRLTKLARLRLWPLGSPFLPPGTMAYPARQRWFATQTQMSNEPTYVDGGEGFGERRIYYHSGLDIGGAEGLTEVVSATDGLAVGVGKAILDEHKAGTFGPRYDAVYVLDSRGWYHCYLHLQSIDPALRPGERVKMGQRIGLLGKEGDSGGWAHLHYEIRGPQPSGQIGTVEGYAFLWEAYVREQRPDMIAVARPHHLALVGEKVALDGSRSWSSAGRIARYQWTFSDGGKASGARVERTYSRPGNYSEILKVTDSRGRTAWDFATVDIVDPAHRDQRPPAIHAAYWPTMDIRPAQAVTFKVRTFGTTDGEELWDFGDGTAKAVTKSDGNLKALAKDGYVSTTHAFARPGDYLVRVERANARGEKAIGRLWVRVGRR
jgi:murein DD-endopeptidase MepM/ murein hydrolase activator NlpD